MKVFTVQMNYQFGDQSLKFHAPPTLIFLQAVTHWGSYEGVSRRLAFLHCLTTHFLYIAFIMTDKIILLSLQTWQPYAILILTTTCTVNSLMMWSRNLNKFVES